jgi:hypothetical protein
MADLEAADAACEILEIIRSASLSKTSQSEESMLSKQVWSVLCRQPSDVDSKLGVRFCKFSIDLLTVF